MSVGVDPTGTDWGSRAALRETVLRAGSANCIKCSSSARHGASVKRSMLLRPGALFAVGDPKQSIFRFRRADIDVYNIVRQRFSEPGVGSVLPLTLNFRSAPQLCNWANDISVGADRARPSVCLPRC